MEIGAAVYYQWVVFPFEGHWLLGQSPASPWANQDNRLTRGERIEGPLPSLDIVILDHNKPMDFNCALLGFPIVSSRGAELLRRVAPADVQLIPCRIDGADRGYRVVNITSVVDCLDRVHTRSTPAPGPHGLSLMVPRYVIDPARAGGHRLFRLRDEPAAMVVSEVLKQAIMDEGLVGPGLVRLDGNERDYFYPGLAETHRVLPAQPE